VQPQHDQQPDEIEGAELDAENGEQDIERVAVADPKMIFKSALEHLASSIILSHNHPSGNLSPSQADKDLTKKLRAAGNNLDISVLDHLIFTDKNYFSFADEGLF
jgi:DNA repair protein RadC